MIGDPAAAKGTFQDKRQLLADAMLADELAEALRPQRALHDAVIGVRQGGHDSVGLVAQAGQARLGDARPRRGGSGDGGPSRGCPGRGGFGDGGPGRGCPGRGGSGDGGHSRGRLGHGRPSARSAARSAIATSTSPGSAARSSSTAAIA